MIFGATTESTRNVLGEKRGEPTAEGSTDEAPAPRPKLPGHGRNAAAAYTGAEQKVLPAGARVAGWGLHPQLVHLRQGTHNNTSERALKKAILHRKNALFYRTLAGAHVGDVFMSLIHAAELNDVAPFDYLVALQRNAAALAANPSAWMPWNHQAALTSHPAGPDPPE